MTERQYKKADSMVFPTLMVVMVGTFLNMLGMVSSGGLKMLVVTVGSALGAVLTGLFYKSYKGTRKCGIWMSVMALVVCFLVILFVDAQFFFMLIAPVFIAQVAYLEKKRILVSAIIIVPVYAVRSIMLANKGVVSLTEAGTSVVILVLVIVSVYNITKISIAFNEDNLETVRRVSEELVNHFGEANRYISTLDEALDVSNHSMKDIAVNIESTAREIQNQSQMCLGIENNAQNAKVQADTMVQATKDTLKEVVMGAEAMEKLHSQAKDVERDNTETVKYASALNERARAVKNILGMINDISIQTHLLALNASVEAARAGEAGRGFSVVADEIGNLSEQTKVATGKIADILSELNEDVKQVTESIEHSVKTVDEQNQLIEETKGKFDVIDTGVKQLMDIISEFKMQIDRITDASVVIADGVTELSANSEEVAATSQDGTRIMTKAVGDMDQVKNALTNIYNLAQNLRDEYNVG